MIRIERQRQMEKERNKRHKHTYASNSLSLPHERKMVLENFEMKRKRISIEEKPIQLSFLYTDSYATMETKNRFLLLSSWPFRLEFLHSTVCVCVRASVSAQNANVQQSVKFVYICDPYIQGPLVNACNCHSKTKCFTETFVALLIDRFVSILLTSFRN